MVKASRRHASWLVSRSLTWLLLTAAPAADVANTHAAAAPPPRSPTVALVRTPDGGIQPQAVVDNAGTVHLLYFKGEPGHGDLFYARLAEGATTFSPALRVNSEPGSVIATGSVRGGQMALGRAGFVHVAWNASRP